MLAEERALTSGALWTEPRIGDWRGAWNTPAYPDASEEALPRGEDGRRSVLLGASVIAHCFGNTHRTRPPPCAARCRVAGPRCRDPAPSEPDVTIARHPA